MADILPNDAAEQFNRRDLIAMCDVLADDQLAARGIYLAVSGLQDLGVNPRDLEAISVMIRRLENRLEERREQAEELQEAIATHFDEEALRRPGGGTGIGIVRAHIEGDSDERYDAVTTAERKIEELHARTPLGLAVKLRYPFHELEVSPATQNALVYGGPIMDDLLQDDRERLGWSVVQIAERLARPAAGRA